MKELAPVLGKMGFINVRTYIQSGNVVFQCQKAKAQQLAKQISDAVSKSHGFRPQVIVLNVRDIERAAAANPFPQAEAEPKSLHLFFLAEAPKNANLDSLNRIKADNEAFVLDGLVFYLHAPDGIGRSKLAASVEKFLGVDATGRNWRTVSKVLEIATKS